MMAPAATRTTEIVLVLSEDHGVITGTLRCPEFYLGPAADAGTLSGRHVEFESTILGNVTFEGDRARSNDEWNMHLQRSHRHLGSGTVQLG